jgi:peptidoglycan/LPS O-acetylase OafA/YrhL
MRIVGYTLLGGIAAGSIIQALHGETDGFFRRLLRKRWLCFVGAISYGLYIYHTLVQCVVSDWLHDCPRIDGVVGVAVITLAVTFLVAYFSYNLVEVPVMRLKRHFAK